MTLIIVKLLLNGISNFLIQVHSIGRRSILIKLIEVIVITVVWCLHFFILSIILYKKYSFCLLVLQRYNLYAYTLHVKRTGGGGRPTNRPPLLIFGHETGNTYFVLALWNTLLNDLRGFKILFTCSIFKKPLKTQN